MSESNAAVSRPTPVLIPLAAATSNALPSVCVLTGQPTAARWKRKLRNRTTISMPVNEELLATYRKRSRTARSFFFASVLAWALAVFAAVPAANAPKTSPFGPIAGWMFVLGLPLFMVAIVLLAKQTGTIPISWRLIVGDDGARYLRIGNPNHAFAAALTQATPTSSDGSEVLPSIVAPPETRRHTPIRWKFLIAYGLCMFGYFFFIIKSGGQSSLIIVVALLLGIALVAASLKWRIHLGSVFTLTPLNAIIILGIGALAGAFGLIGALDPQHGTSAATEATAGIGSAVIAMIIVVVAEVVWNGVRTLLRRSRP